MKAFSKSIILVLIIFSCKSKPLTIEDGIIGTWEFSEASYQKGFKKIDFSNEHNGKTFTFNENNTFEIDSVGIIKTGTWVLDYDYMYIDDSNSNINYELILSFSNRSSYNNPWIWKYVSFNKKRLNFSYQQEKKLVNVKLIK